MSGPAVATFGLSVRFGRESALDGVDLRVPEGAFYALVGVNGAGKSTLMRVLLNLERPHAGRAEVFGLDTGFDGPRVRAQIGHVAEGDDVDSRWMACGRWIEHVAVHRPSWDRAYASRLVEAFGVQPGRRIGTLSKGEARRLQFVTALAHRPPLLLLDEPTDGLDPLMRKSMLARLAEHLADSPATVLMATHQVHEIASLADHVGVLRAGRLVVQMTRDEMRRTVVRHRIETPEGWQAPAGLRVAEQRRSPAGREAFWTLIGEPDDVSARLAASGAIVRESKQLALEEAVLAFIGGAGAA